MMRMKSKRCEGDALMGLSGLVHGGSHLVAERMNRCAAGGVTRRGRKQ